MLPHGILVEIKYFINMVCILCILLMVGAWETIEFLLCENNLIHHESPGTLLPDSLCSMYILTLITVKSEKKTPIILNV
jgi:hypothetical protein